MATEKADETPVTPLQCITRRNSASMTYTTWITVLLFIENRSTPVCLLGDLAKLRAVQTVPDTSRVNLTKRKRFHVQNQLTHGSTAIPY
jgi:hypothetical protein